MTTAMKKYMISALALVGIAFTSCENSTPTDAYGEGVLDFSNITATVEESTRATSTDNFIVTLSKASGEQLDSWTIATLPEQVMLRAGDYRVDVASAESHAAVSREGYFVGSGAFAIIAGETTSLDPIVCPLQSLKVSIEFEGEIQEALGEDCQTTVSVGEASITVAATDSAPIYFCPLDARNMVKIVFEGTVDGAAERFETEVAGVRVGQWRHIVIKMTYEDGERVFSAAIDPWKTDDDIVVE